MTDKCHGFMGRIRCNFVPRYDGLPLSPEVIEALAKIPGVRSFEGASTYVCDVCTACGERRDRPESKR